MEKIITIKSTEDGSYSLESVNVPLMELVGVLRFFEKKVRTDLSEKSKVQSNINDTVRSDSAFDELYEKARILAIKKKYCSTKLLKTELKIGDNMAGMIMDKLEKNKIIELFSGSKERKVII